MTGVASTGKIGIGVLLQVSDGNPSPTWATVANVTTLSGGGATLDMVDSTHLNSPDFYAEMTPGLKHSTAWTGTVQWDPSDPTLGPVSGLAKFLEDRSIQTFRINPSQLGIMTTLECDAYCSELGNIDVSPTGLMTQAFTLTPTGAIRRVDL